MVSDSPNEPAGSDRPRRRPRYAGTHPKQFDQRYKELNPADYPEIQGHVRAQGRTPAGTHVPIMVAEVLAALQPAPGEVVADCTLGYGGHALEFIRCIGPTGRLVGFDVDATQLDRTAERLAAETGLPVAREAGGAGAPVVLLRSHFGGVAKTLGPLGLEGYDVIFADLGLSSMQVDDPARGFSYKYDGPLDMRMDQRLPHTAADVLQALTADELSAALAQLSDEPDHRRIARHLVARRAVEPITQTQQLVRLVFEAKGISRQTWRAQADRRRGELHPAARTFQALRIMVNDELTGLEQLLRVAPYCLRPGGRMGILTFHSGEERRVQYAFEEGLASGLYTTIAAEAVRPTPQEIGANPRSKAARLRWARHTM